MGGVKTTKIIIKKQRLTDLNESFSQKFIFFVTVLHDVVPPQPPPPLRTPPPPPPTEHTHTQTYPLKNAFICLIAKILLISAHGEMQFRAYIALDRGGTEGTGAGMKIIIFLISLKKAYVIGTHEKRLREALLMSTHNICFIRDI